MPRTIDDEMLKLESIDRDDWKHTAVVVQIDDGRYFYSRTMRTTYAWSLAGARTFGPWETEDIRKALMWCRANKAGGRLRIISPTG